MSMPRPLTILYVDNSFTFGGAINALADLLRELDRTRYRPVVLSAQDPEVLARLFPGTPTRHWAVRLPWVHDTIHRRVIRLPWLARGPLGTLWSKARAASWLAFYEVPEALRIARLARRQGVDMIHLNNGVESLVPPLLAGKLLRIPVVAHARGPQDTHGIARVWAGMADHWIAVSEWVAGNLRDAGVTEDRLTVVHDAIDIPTFEAADESPSLRADLGIPQNAPVFGVFARIIPWKGIREFVAAARHVIAAVPDAYALVVGDRSDGSEDYYQEVVAMAKDLGIADRVVFTGFREDVPALMRTCNVVVHTSIDPEPFGLTVVEGMATGRPVVAANAGGPTEIVVEGETGLLVDPAEEAELGDAVIRLLTAPGTAEEMGRNAAIRARRYFSAPRYAQDVGRVYEDLLNHQRRPAP